MESISNLYPVEGTLSGCETIEFPWRARYIEIINDNASDVLRYKFSPGEAYATLKPLEAVTANVKSKTLYLEGTGEYRVRGEG